MKKRLGDYIQEYSVRNKSGEDIPVYSITNSQGFCRDYFSKEVASKDKTTYKIVPRGCFAYNPSRINVGSVDWQRDEERVIVSPLYNVFSVSPEIDQQYLYYYLKSSATLYRIKEVATGSVRDNLRLSMLYDFMIELPSLDVQRQIVSNLDLLASIIRQRNQQLTKLDELIKARFVELTENVNTVPTRMGDIATYINGYAFKPTDWKESGLPIIRIQNLNDATARYNYFDGKIDSKYLVTTGDILVSWATHLEAYIWNGNRAWLNQHIFKVLFNKIPINKIYFVYATEDALRQAFKNAHGFKPTMEHIKRSDFENAIVKLPPMEIQNQFAAFVAEVDKSKVEVQKALDQTQLLFDSLMQQYFG